MLLVVVEVSGKAVHPRMLAAKFDFFVNGRRFIRHERDFGAPLIHTSYEIRSFRRTTRTTVRGAMSTYRGIHVRMDRTDEALTAAFAEVLRRRRLAAGLSQEKLAEQADVSVRFISFLENRRRQPTLTIIAALSRGLGITLAEFAGDIEVTWLDAKKVPDTDSDF